MTRRNGTFWLMLGLCGCSDRSIKQINSEPTAQITSHDDGETVSTETDLALRGVVGDANHSTESLGVTWLLNDIVVCESATPSADGVVTCTVPLLPPTAEVVLEVRDPLGAADSDWRTFTVEDGEETTENQPPTCSIIEPTDEAIALTGDDVQFSATVSDSNQAADGLRVRWHSDRDGEVGTSTPTPSGEVLWTISTLSAGVHTITLNATDDEEATCTDEVVISLVVDADRDGYPAETDCDDEDPLAFDANGASPHCPAQSCLDILDRGHSVGDGTYWLVAGASSPASYEAFCLMDTAFDGGGWTLTAVFSDDGQDTWTWNDRHLLDTDTRALGDVASRTQDMKSPAYHDVIATEVMFLHQPSGIWAAYALPTDHSTLAETIAAAGTPAALTAGSGIPMIAGTLTAGQNLNDTQLYFNALDCDRSGENSYGPTWNATLNHRCSFDDPGSNGVGPTELIGNLETNVYADGGAYAGVFSVGFGLSRGLNTGTPGIGANHLQSYSR